MQKIKKLWIFSFISMAIALFTVWGIFSIIKSTSKVNADQLPEGVEYAAYIDKSVSFTEYSEDTGYVYAEGTRKYVTKNEIISDVNGKYVEMLENNENGAIQNTNFNILRNSHDSYVTSGIAENFYFTIGTAVSGPDATLDPSKTYLTALQINMFLNGKMLYINPRNSTNVMVDNKETSIDYWYQYIDLTNMYYSLDNDPNQKGEKVENPQGTFTLTFQFSTVKNNQIGNAVTYQVSYTTLSQKTYKDNFPYFENTLKNVDTSTYFTSEGSSSPLQYYYNFNNKNNIVETKKVLPSYVFDAKLYGLNITRQYNDLIEYITTEFSIDENQTGKLNINYWNADKQTLIKKDTVTIPNDGGKYIYKLEFEDFGVYTVENFYMVETTKEGSTATRTFQMATGSNVLANPTESLQYFKNVEKDVSVSGDAYGKNTFILNNVGIKSFFLDYSKVNKEIDNYSVIKENNQNYSDTNWLTANIASKIESNTGSYSLTNYLNTSYNTSLFKTIFGANIQTVEEFNNNFPVLNQGPISFERFGTINQTKSKYKIYPTFNDLLNGTTDSNIVKQGVITKDTKLTQVGYYEVLINYEYNGIDFAQAFIFCIDKSSPTSTLYTYDAENGNKEILTKKYTNKIVEFEFPKQTYFQAPIRARYIRTELGTGFSNNFDGVEFNYTSGTQLIDDGNYSIQLVFGETDSYYIEQFVIDTLDIDGMKYSPIDAVYNENNQVIGYTLKSDISTSNANLTSHPFTFLFNEKLSDAKIEVKYKKFNFELISSSGNLLDNVTALETNKYVTTGYKLVNKVSAYSDYFAFDKNSLEVPEKNVFVDNTSGLYIFELVDEAGNTATFFVIYDLTKPQVVFNPQIENKYNIVNSATDIIWGQSKATLVEKVNDGDESFNNLLNDPESNFQSYFSQIENKNYMSVKNSNVVFEYYLNNVLQTTTINVGATSDDWHKTIYPTQEDAPQGTSEHFIGEKDYTITITPSTNTNYTTSLNNDVKSKFNISMNLDSSIGIFNGYYDEHSDNSTGIRILKDTSTNSNKLRFSLIPKLDEVEDPNRVIELSYEYYPVAVSEYENLQDGSSLTIQANSDGKPNVLYPFSKNPTITKTLISNGSIVDMSSYSDPEDPERVFSNIINPTIINGETFTQEGFYIFKRVYDEEKFATVEDSNDTLIRYYAVCVTREGIINISDSISTGKNISFSMPNGNKEPVIFTAEDIQSYISAGETNLFTTNKLPLKFTLPNDKYDAETTLNNISNIDSEYLINAINLNNRLFGLKLTLTNKYLLNNGYTTENVVVDNVVNRNYNTYKIFDDTGSLINPSSDTRVRESGFNKAGSFTVTISDSSGIDKFPSNTTTFNYTISHYSPNGKFINNNYSYSERPSQTEANKTIFKSTNQKEIYFSFNDKGEVGGINGIDMFKAEIDPTNIEVKQILPNGAVGKTYTIKNQEQLNTAIAEGLIEKVNFNSAGDVVEDNDPGIIATNYIIHITSETSPETSIMNGTGTESTYEVKLCFVGNENDYIGTSANGETVNYFYRTFSITVDRTKPSANVNKLKANDKFTDSSFTANLESYMFAVTDLQQSSAFFKFTRENNNVNESDEIFARYLSSPLNYLQTITPDNPNYKNLVVYPNNPMFEEGNSIYVNLQGYNEEGVINLETLGESGYYEIIERDEAGNYIVYVVHYVKASDLVNYVPNLNISYNNVNSDTPIAKDISGNYNDILTTQYTTEILGENFSINNIKTYNYVDLFQKVTVNINNQREKTFISTAEDKQLSNLNSFLSEINSYIKTQTESSLKNGYKVTITLTNRFFENYVITYLIAGAQLEPIYNINETKQTIQITIPNDNETTKIVAFRVYKFENGAWKLLNTDNSSPNPKPIITSAELVGRESLAGDTYNFGAGEYQFELIDNFGRGLSENNESFFKGVGISNVAYFSDFYNNQQPAEGGNVVNYTAKPFTFTYQSNYYNLNIYLPTENGNFSKTPINTANNPDWLTQYSALIEESRVVGSIITYKFKNNENAVERKFKIELVYTRGTIQQIQTYILSIYNILPEINLYNLSGAILPNSNDELNPTILTQPFRINWETDNFNTVVNLTRVYTDDLGRTQTENINNISQNYLIDKPGFYTASITNKFGYTHTEYNRYFKYLEDNVELYSVIAVENGMDKTFLKNADNNEVYVDEQGKEHPLIVYYATTDFDGSNSNKYIEIRVNTDQQLQSESIPNPSGIEVPNEKYYKISSMDENTSFGYIRYIKIKFINASTNFAEPLIEQPNNEGNLEAVDIPSNNTIKTIKDYLKISWSIKNSDEIFDINSAYNKVNITVLYRDALNNLVKLSPAITIDEESAKAYITLTKAGKYVISFSDLAGNTHLFNGSSNLNITIANDVLFTVNNNEPIQNQYFNDEVIIKVLKDSTLYYGDPIVTATRNGETFEIEKVENTLDSYIFKLQGYYQVTISTKITINGEIVDLITIYSFTIINNNQSNLCFNIPESYNFRIVEVIKNENENITDSFDSLNSLWLSPADTGNGIYDITLLYDDVVNGIKQTFSFSVWIGDEQPVLISNYEFGTSTNKEITITYNPQAIYSQIGESYIKISGFKDIEINSESPNTQANVVLKENREYWIRITSKDGKIITSYKITKVEPLNTTAIIIIVVVCVLVVALTVVFIILRKHIKFR